MNLQEFTSPLPKPWLNINANSLTTITEVSKNKLSLYGTLVATGTTPITLTAEQFVSSILVIDVARTANISIPLSATIDAYLGPYAQNGVTIQCIVINRNPTDTLDLVSSEIAAQSIPKAQSIASSSTTFYFIRQDGLYVPLNT